MLAKSIDKFGAQATARDYGLPVVLLNKIA
jgi:hypothetical protein